MSLITRLTDATTRFSTEFKSIRGLINGNAPTLDALTTTNKTNLVGALNSIKSELNAVAAASGAVIDDAATTSTTKTYSISKIIDLVNTTLANITNGAPAALDTLDELAAAIGDDSNFAATVTTALSNRLRFDAAQTLTSAQKAQGAANLGVPTLEQIGDTDTNFVTIFNNGLI